MKVDKQPGLWKGKQAKISLAMWTTWAVFGEGRGWRAQEEQGKVCTCIKWKAHQLTAIERVPDLGNPPVASDTNGALFSSFKRSKVESRSTIAEWETIEIPPLCRNFSRHNGSIILKYEIWCVSVCLSVCLTTLHLVVI